MGICKLKEFPLTRKHLSGESGRRLRGNALTRQLTGWRSTEVPPCALIWTAEWFIDLGNCGRDKGYIYNV